MQKRPGLSLAGQPERESAFSEIFRETGYFRRNRQKVKDIMKKIIKVIRAIGYLIAFSLILYPVVSNYINQMHSTTIATDYEQEVSHLS